MKDYKKEQKINKIKVDHDLRDVSEGVDYIMTIKDKGVLENDDEDLDILENEILNQNKKLKLSEKKDLEKEHDIYLKDQILTKYDDKLKTQGFIISNSQKFNKIKNSDINIDLELNENSLDNTNPDNFSNEEMKKIKEKLKKLKVQPLELKYNQLNFETKFSTDYLTPEEFKPKEFKRKKITNNKGIKSIQKEENLDEPENYNLNSSKDDQKNKIFRNDFDEYEELNKFLEKQRELANKNKIIVAPEEKIIQILNSKIETENNSTEIEILGNQKNEKNLNEGNNKIQNNPENKIKENTKEFLTITETSEFLKNIPSKKDQEEEIKIMTSVNINSIKDVKSGTASVAYIPLPSERIKYGLRSVISNVSENDKFLNKKRLINNKISEKQIEEELIKLSENKNKKSIEENNNEESNTNISETEKSSNDLQELTEPDLGKGIAVALEVFRKRGLIVKDKLYGRYKDNNFENRIEKKTTNEIEKNKQKKNNFNIDLEYRDEKGRAMKPKEAYRYMCYIFHNKLPGFSKIEKRKRREEMEEKLNNKDTSNETKTFQYLKNHQIKNNTSYVVLQGKNTNI